MGRRRPLPRPRAGAARRPAAAARAIEAAEAAARRAELTIRLEQDTQLPPCTFERPARVAHLFTLTRGAGPREGYRQLRACEPCIVRAQCPGFPEETLARVGEHDDERGALARPIAQDRVRRRLNVISSVEEQIARELTQEDVVRRPGEAAVRSRIVRVNFRCNQACHFCFVSTHLPAAEDAAVEDAIRGIARVGGKLVLSGGEPTLNPRLLDYVRLGKREGARAIELQTNAIRLAEPGLARALAEAGVDEAFISLHGSTAEISDAVTNAPGTFARTVVGIDQVVAAGITTRVNFVFCRANLEDFPAYVELVAARWPAAMLVVSFVATSTDVVPRTAELQPRYSEVIPPLADGLRRAAARGLVVTGFDSMCGIPLCLVPRDVREFFTLATVPEGFDGGEFIKAAACERCELQDKCFGVRRGYAELHGTDEFRPVRADTPA
ncbi:MAG: radical SAM protein [Myxococcales bacterium]|nr:radical SAM protein [Myxococcales bacterium]